MDEYVSEKDWARLDDIVYWNMPEEDYNEWKSLDKEGWTYIDLEDFIYSQEEYLSDKLWAEWEMFQNEKWGNDDVGYCEMGQCSIGDKCEYWDCAGKCTMSFYDKSGKEFVEDCTDDAQYWPYEVMYSYDEEYYNKTVDYDDCEYGECTVGYNCEYKYCDEPYSCIVTYYDEKDNYYNETCPDDASYHSYGDMDYDYYDYDYEESYPDFSECYDECEYYYECTDGEYCSEVSCWNPCYYNTTCTRSWYDSDWNLYESSCDASNLTANSTTDYYVDECDVFCDYVDCEKGQYCVEYECLDTCGDRNCTREFYDDNWNYIEEDCMGRDKTVVCEDYCTYEDCSETANGAQCWIERCDDLCGQRNCSIWVKDAGEWYGQYCPEEPEEETSKPMFRAQDVINGAIMTGEQFNDTFVAALDFFCPDGDCFGVNVTDLSEMEFDDLINGDFDDLLSLVALDGNMTNTTLNTTSIESVVDMAQDSLNSFLKNTDLKNLVNTTLGDAADAFGINVDEIQNILKSDNSTEALDSFNAEP